MKQLIATIAGFLVAPLVPILVMTALDPPYASELDLYFVIAAIIYVTGLVTMLLIGVPTYMLFRRWALIRWWSISIVGSAVGICVGYFAQIPSRSIRIESALIQGVACALAGFVFWLVWRLGASARLPQRDEH